MAQKKVTIKDIARMAEVSPGTVDRVIHNRGKVSEDKKKRINEVLREIDYEPNFIAKTLKNNRQYHLTVLIPEPEKDEYWLKAAKGINRGVKEFKSFGVRIELIPFHIQDPRSFEAAANKVLRSNTDGVLMAPMFAAESSAFCQACQQRNIPYILFNTFLEDASPISFIGQDLYQSGRLAGDLLFLSQKKQGRIIMVHIDETPDNAIHISEKERGIRDFLTERQYPPHLIESVKLFHRKGDGLLEDLYGRLRLDNEISGVIVSTSKSYEVAPAIKQNSPETIIVGYDLIKRNTTLLNEGIITFLINQNPIQQAYQSVQRFADHLIFGREVAPRELLPLEVVTTENLDSILHQRF